MLNILSSSPTLTDCTFTNNSASQGGGMYNDFTSAPTITETIVCGNSPAEQIFGEYITYGGICTTELCADCTDNDCDNWPYGCSQDDQVFYVTTEDGPEALQLAVNLIPLDWTLSLGPGTHLLNTTLDTNGKVVTIRGTVDPETGELLTLLDGQGSHRVLQCLSGEGPDTVFEDLVIRGGNATGSFPDNSGGGMYNSNNSSPTLINCTFTNNSAEFGGGMLQLQRAAPPSLITTARS